MTDQNPQMRMFAPTNSGKGTGIIIPDLLKSASPIVVVDMRADLKRFYRPGGDA